MIHLRIIDHKFLNEEWLIDSKTNMQISSKFPAQTIVILALINQIWNWKFFDLK